MAKGDDEKTELALAGQALKARTSAAGLPVTSSAPKLGTVQISRFIEQKLLDRFPFVIGRSGQCHLVLSHPLVSAQHAQITRRGDATWIEDLHSSNGTYVADAMVRSAKLEP